MDPLSQGVLGAALPLAFARPKEVKVATITGFFAGMMADLDIVIRSATDPLMGLEYHRQFTHSLLFIPIGGALAALGFKYLFRVKLPMPRLYLFSTLGYATHGLLDGCTAYGTQLLWPFSNMRVAWNNVSIVDPLFTFPVLLLLIIAFIRKGSTSRVLPIGFAVFYLLLGVVQYHRAIAKVEEHSANNKHQPTRIDAFPTLGNLLLWRTVYQWNESYYVNAVNIGPRPRFYPGQHTPVLQISKDLPALVEGSTQAKDLKRFEWFTNNFAYAVPNRENEIGDIRYSADADSVTPMWGIKMNPNRPDQHVFFGSLTNRKKYNYSRFFKMIKGLPVEPPPKTGVDK